MKSTYVFMHLCALAVLRCIQPYASMQAILKDHKSILHTRYITNVIC